MYCVFTAWHNVLYVQLILGNFILFLFF
uniref:Uncharacterized protein n=1 Tax=Anguilla anguilla TaxID=7936 RepID=A0A0E9RQ02_ANGAN